VIIDLSEVYGLDFSGFGVLLAKLRDVLRMTVSITGIGVSDVVSLQSMGLLDGIAVERRRADLANARTVLTVRRGTRAIDRLRIAALPHVSADAAHGYEGGLSTNSRLPVDLLGD
jgi:hypothetical protein